MSDRISRSYDFTIRDTSETDDGLTLEGYAAVFGSPTEIHDRHGTYMETVARGAFAKTIQERTPILQFDHGTHPMIGSIPLGSIRKIEEDDQGLYVRARLSNNWLVEPVRDAIRDGGITGMSFQFTVPEARDEWNKDMTERTIREVVLYELGPVVWPAYQTTTVGVRSEIATVLSCENLRTDLARALYTDFVSPDAATRTSGETDDTPPVEAPVVDKTVEAAAALRVAKNLAVPV